ncbi:Ca-activated chloride channel family protein [Xylanibacter ruminicola]|uniref:Ca-activated chloride channel family protein n=1 Tax=Xylanibacter ruminicola TaxID=839 RepID=A0A1M7P260_XYLRU|nr:tetratricopeptide repeat protein [Xylanibacter ruminicola]SFC77808.1 Ca-activated chloride channel family protein [Xylanibacter ruminicola]SHN10504.1 Ca-activated chloride channel family protein [Xylanibacter ruminicola]
MFRFADPTYLYLLAVIPVLAIIRFLTYRNQKKRLRKFGDPKLLRSLMPDVSRFRPAVKFWILQGALALLVVMLARPQFGTKISNEQRTGIETIIAMDISNSMLAEDITPSRLDRSKMMVENLVDHFTNDKIGLLVFAGDAFVQLPITSDYVSAKMFLSSIDPSMMATQGTDIARAIDMASHSFTQEEGIGKAIIVITDGEDHEGGALEAAEAAKKAGMRVYVLGVGSTQGAPIPIPGTGDYMKDNTGNTVMSALNEDMCRQVAQAGGGAYIHVENNSAAQDQLDNELSKLAKKETTSTVYSEFDEQFQAVAILALLLLILEICIFDRRNPLLKRLSLFGSKKKAAATVALLLVAVTASAQTDRQYIREGNKQFRVGQYDKAEVSYRKAVEKNPKNPQAAYNLGNALMAQKKDSSAVQQFEQATRIETNPLRKAAAYHNMGVICQTHKMYGEAIEAYKNALRLNPNDNETRYNLVLCQRQKKKQDQNQQQNQNNKDDQKKDNQKKDDQKDQNKDKKDDKQQQQQKPQMSKDNAEQLLNAAIQNEKMTQDKMKKQQQKPQRRNVLKNW